MDAPANTLSYMIAGYVVIFSGLIIYVVSLFIRQRNLSQEEAMLIDLDQEKEKKEKENQAAVNSPADGVRPG
jgi:CcmD family protein